MQVIFALEKVIFEQYLNFKNAFDADKFKSQLGILEPLQEDEDFKIDIEGNARIPIIGALRRNDPGPWFKFFFGNTTSYNSIIKSVEKANSNPQVKKIIFEINSPGGAVDGVDEAALAIKNSEKPTEAQVHTLAASAAYWLASQTDKIIAVTPTSRVGSIGVLTEVLDASKLEEDLGLKYYVLTSTDAPNKFPDVSKKSGRDLIVSELDDLHKVFVERIAEGRKTTVKNVNDNFGKGGVVIAEQAKSVGMIDDIIGSTFVIDENSSKQRNETKTKQEEKTEMTPEEFKAMTPDKLKAENLELYNQIFGLGVNQERERVESHLNWLTKGVDPEYAEKAIREGEDFGSKAQSHYMSEATLTKEKENREKDNAAEVETEVEEKETKEEKEEAKADNVFKQVKENFAEVK